MQPASEVTFHPLDLSTLGRTPAGLPVWRIVWADSRKMKASYEGKIHELLIYDDQPAAMGHWILEKWLPVEKFIGMTREQYAEFLNSTMYGAPQVPYPEGGDYELSYIFADRVDPETAFKVPAMIEYGMNNFTPAERAEGIKQAEEKRMVDAAEEKSKIIQTAIGRSK